MKNDKKPDLGTSEPKFDGPAWTMSYTTEDNLPPLERLIWELRGNKEALYFQRNLLFWLLLLSLVIHSIR